VGKTSVITAMYNSQREAVQGTGLFLRASADTATMLDGKQYELRSIFKGVHQDSERVQESGIPGDSAETLFEFSYGMNSENINIDLEIRDYPGEYLMTEPERVAEFIREASAVLIAIDTPHLMEEGGKYHLAKNRMDLVADFLMHHLDRENEKLVLLVPLKCEKYYRENRIDEVTERVCQEYAGLIEYLRDRQDLHGLKKKLCCAVTPIQTLGNVVFDAFERDPATGMIREITTRDGMPLPATVLYRYTASNAEYNPVNCAQPLYYLLSFVSKQYEKSRQEKARSGWLGRFWEALRLIPNVEAFLLEIQRLGMRRIEGAQGYKILFGRGRI